MSCHALVSLIWDVSGLVPDRDLLQPWTAIRTGLTGKPSPYLTGCMRVRNPAMSGPEGLVRR